MNVLIWVITFIASSGGNILTENGTTETVIYTYQDNNSIHQFQLG